MDIWMESISLILSALLGAALVLFLNAPDKKWMKLVISFSGAYLLGLCMVHVLPFSMEHAPGIAGFLVLAGFLLQLILEYFSEGVEHGHLHIHHQKEKAFPLAVMLSLFVHAFIEGMPFGDHVHDHHHQSLLIGIALHKFPVAMVLTAMLLKSGVAMKKVLMWLILFALMSPLGTLVYHSYLVNFPDVNSEYLTGSVNALLVGVLLHVSTTILFESTDGHKFNLLKFISVIIGFILSALII